MATLKYLSQYFSTTLNVGGGIDDSQTTGIILQSVSGVTDITKPGQICITYSDPIDTSVAEWIDYTSINGSNELVGAVRGREGFSAHAHLQGATVAFVMSASHHNDVVDLLNGTEAGIKVKTAIYDENGNEVIKTPATTSAVNEVTITNSATGNAVQIKATGGDTNIELEIGAKGNKQIKQTSAIYQAFQSYTPSASATATLDLSLGNDHRITMPAGNVTIALSNEQVGQKFLVSITQDGGGSRTVTWFSTIKWAGGSAPTLTTTASKRDTFGFVVTGSGTYDGFIVGQNI